LAATSYIPRPTAEQLLKRLWDSHYGVRYDPIAFDCFWLRDLQAVQAHLPLIVDLEAGRASGDAIVALLHIISAGKHSNPEHELYVPRGWFHVFHELFLSASISRAAWGIAARVIYTISAPNVADAAPNAALLPALRAVDPCHLMRARDYDRWRHLPAHSTIYRGACATTVAEAAAGLSWTPDPEVAVSYALVRAAERYDHGECAGWPRLVEAKVPRRLIIAVCDEELLVDYQSLPLSVVEEVQPMSPANAAAFRLRLRQQSDETRATRAAAGHVGPLGF
jgi:hypothetical protein